MSGRTHSGDSPAAGADTDQESTTRTTSMTTTPPTAPATSGQQTGGEGGGGPTEGGAGGPTTPDRLTPRIGIITLGVVALLCVVALIYLSAQPEPPGTTPQPAEANQPSGTGPVAVEVANDTGALGLLGQIVGVLGTVAAAAIGGIAGFLTGARSTSTTETPGTGSPEPDT
jgi:hypothetical protein